MKAIIFAGGTGTRLWPLSRKALPKQFKQMFDGKSTLQLAVKRLENTFGMENILISTNERYVAYVKEQIPRIPLVNIIAEPEKRDVAPAVGFNLMHLRKQGYKGPVAVLWADHLMKNVDNFIECLNDAEKLVKKDPDKIVFIAEKPLFANNNLGWIRIGKKIKDNVNTFVEWKYKPPADDCKKMFSSGEWFWNPGYFIFDIDHMISLYKDLQPEMYKVLTNIEKSIGTVNENKTIKKLYPTLPKLSFDAAIAENIPSSNAYVLTSNMGWADPGTLYAWKQAVISNEEDNLLSGLTYIHNSRDSLIYNEELDKLVAGVGLDGIVVINTKDALIVVPKDKVLQVTDMVNQLDELDTFKRFL